MGDSLPAPGWYTDPGDPRRRRWWDGESWTDDSEPHVTEGSLTSELLGDQDDDEEAYPTQVLEPPPPAEVTPVAPSQPLVPVMPATPAPTARQPRARHRRSIAWARFVAGVLTLLGVLVLIGGVVEAIYLVVQASVLSQGLPSVWVPATRDLAYQWAFVSLAAGLVGGFVLLGLAALIRMTAITAEVLDARA